jgi:hypothetical protein
MLLVISKFIGSRSYWDKEADGSNGGQVVIYTSEDDGKASL